MSTPRASTFDRLVAEHHGEVFRICRSILHDEHLGADAAQETFVRAWRGIRGDARSSAPRNAAAWIGKVAVTSSIDLLRRRRRGRWDERSADDPLQVAAAPRRQGPAARAMETELLERFERALGALSEGQRTVFLLRHDGDLRLSEIADLLGLSLPTVKTQFARACLKLQSGLTHFRLDEEQER